MATVKFDVYKLNESGATVGLPIEWDPEVDSAATVAKKTNAVLALRKEKDVVLSPNGEEAAFVLGKKRSRGSKVVVPAEAVRMAHELYEAGDALSTIPLKLYAKFETIFKEPVIKSILLQERDTDVEGIDDLREAVAAKLANGTGRRKYTDEVKQSWIDRHLDGESGSQIAKSGGPNGEEINSSVVNKHLSDAGVQRNARGSGVKKVNTTK